MLSNHPVKHGSHPVNLFLLKSPKTLLLEIVIYRADKDNKYEHFYHNPFYEISFQIT